jgi:hypothetical protein
MSVRAGEAIRRGRRHLSFKERIRAATSAGSHHGATSGNDNGNGNGKNVKLPSLSEGRIDFEMPSFEATMTLPAEAPVDIADTVVGKDLPKK